MHDPTRTWETLETLADIYLTNGAPAPPTPPAEAEEAHTDHPDDQLDAPLPIKLFPHKQADGTPQTNDYPTTTNQHTRPDQIDQPRHATPRQTPPHIEAVFLGNLPGFSGPWLIQYAHHLAKQHGCVGVISVNDNNLDIDIVGLRNQDLSAIEIAAPTTGPSDQATILKLLDRLPQSGPARINAWLIQLPTPFNPQSLDIAQQLHRWTLLCGADDTAVVSVYRLLKQLTTQNPTDPDAPIDPASTQDPSQNHQIGVMVMGSDEASSQVAAMKLNHTAGSFLGTPVELVGSRKQIQPVQVRPLGHLTDDVQNPTNPAIRFLQAVTSHTPADRPDTAKNAQTDSPTTTQAPPSITKQPMPLETPESKAQPTRPQPTTQPIASQHHDATENLSSFLQHHATPLEARCPRWPNVQLALDNRGRLHLLALRLAEQTNQSINLNDAIDELTHASDWATEHLLILQLTQPQSAFDTDAQPVLHIFTDLAKPAVALAGRSRTSVKVHLLQHVHVANTDTWHATKLN